MSGSPSQPSWLSSTGLQGAREVAVDPANRLTKKLVDQCAGRNLDVRRAGPWQLDHRSSVLGHGPTCRVAFGEERDRLNELLTEAAEQYALMVNREWRAGTIDWHELNQAYQALRERQVPGLRAGWAAAGLPHLSKILQMVRNQPDPDDGLWSGPYPFAANANIPERGACVAYVLYTDDLQPCYVGSTQHFSQRMRNHHRDGKVWSFWTAYPCRDRQLAYEVEQRFLDQYFPELNQVRKTGRSGVR